MDRFHACLQFTLGFEGSYSNDPADKGGATMWGVTQAVYDDYRRDEGESPKPVKEIAKSERDDIYTSRYWNAVHAGAFDMPLALALFDVGVNQGVGRAIKFYQVARGLIADGRVGPVTIADMRKVGEMVEDRQRDIAVSICNQSRAYYQSIVKKDPSQNKFLKGWLRRADARSKAVKGNE